MKRLDQILDQKFRDYIKDRDSDGNTGNCYTCDMPLFRHEMQCGHYVPRANLNTRWDPRNGKIQCNYCNVVQRGNHKEYRKRLIRDYGEDWVLQLEADGRVIRRSMTDNEKREILKTLFFHV